MYRAGPGARSGGDGQIARATERAEKPGDGRGVRHEVERAAQEGRPIDTRMRRVELAAEQSLPVRDGEDVRRHT